MIRDIDSRHYYIFIVDYCNKDHIIIRGKQIAIFLIVMKIA